MLLSIRRGATTLAFKIIIAFFIVALIVLFSLGDYIGAFNLQDEDPVVYKVSAVAVTESQLSAQIVQTGYPLRNAIPGGLDTADKIKASGIHEIAANVIIGPEVARQEYKRLGLATSQKDVARFIAADDQYRGSDGKFSDTLYQGRLSLLGLDNNTYRRQLQSTLSGQSVTSALKFEPASLPAIVTEPLLTNSFQQRKFETVLVDKKLAEEPTPTEDDLKAYLAENTDRFKVGELRKISAVFIIPTNLQADVEVTDEQLEKAYTERKSRYAREETRTVRQIVFDSDTQARIAIDALGDEKTLDALAAATERSIAKLPAAMKLTSQFGTDAFKLEQGALSDPVKSDFGWHVLQVDAINAAYDPTLVQLKGTLTNALKEEEAGNQAEELSIEMDKLVGEGADLQEIAETLKLKVDDFEPVSNEGFNAVRGSIASLPRDRKFLSTIFSTPKDEISFLGTTDRGVHYVISVDDILDPRDQTFEEAKPQLEGIVKREQWSAGLKAKTEELIASGKSLADIATELEVEVEASEYVNRTNISAETTSARFLRGEAFEMPTADGLTAVPAGANYLVTRLIEIKEENVAESDEGKALVERLAGQYQSELAQQYQRALRAKSNVSMSEAAMDRAVNTAARAFR